MLFARKTRIRMNWSERSIKSTRGNDLLHQPRLRRRNRILWSRRTASKSCKSVVETGSFAISEAERRVACSTMNRSAMSRTGNSVGVQMARESSSLKQIRARFGCGTCWFPMTLRIPACSRLDSLVWGRKSLNCEWAWSMWSAMTLVR